MEEFMGVDIGGTNVKFGIVNTKGQLRDKIKYPTNDLIGEESFAEGLSKALEVQLNLHDHIKKVGIGVPGTLSRDRKTLKELPNIEGTRGLALHSILKDRFPNIGFELENDANAAALGEFYFGEEKLPESFLFVTLGTGIGGAAIIDKKIFTGADGNGLEIGHMVSSNGHTIEERIGKKGMVKYAKKLLKNFDKETLFEKKKELNPKNLEKYCIKHDPLALKVFSHVGKVLGECLVSSIRVTDIKSVLIGGGVADCFFAMEASMMKSLTKYLTPYYLDELNIQLATLGNNAGIVGAASLCLYEDHIY